MSTPPDRLRPTLLLAGILLLASVAQAPAAQNRGAGENDADLRYYVYVSGIT